MSISPLQGKSLGRPRSKACDTCRSAKVKCDERCPLCARCSRLRLQCHWPPVRPQLQPGQASKVGKRRILPALLLARSCNAKTTGLTAEPFSAKLDVGGVLNTSSSLQPEDHACNIRPLVLNGYDPLVKPYTSTERTASSSEQPYLEDPSSFSSLLSSVNWPSSFILHNALILSGNEYRALHHYQTVYTSCRLLKTPRWSTYSCILHSVIHIPMAMHFLIATSLLDMGKRHSISAVHLETSRTHFQKGKELLVRTMMRETKPDHFGTLSSWLFLYQCMMHKETLDPQAIDQVGQSILHYIELYNLDTIAAAPLSNLQDMPFSKYQRSSSLDAGLIARLITFLMHTDVHVAFQGCGGHLANYLHSNGVHQRIISSQRCVLEQFWGSSYPEDEVHQDIEVSIAWQMSYDVLVIFQTINELNRSSQGFVPRNSKMERSLKEIENKYSDIFRLAKSTDVRRSYAKQSADTALCYYHFIQVYYFRTTLETYEQPCPVHIASAMSAILNIAYKAFTSRQECTFDLFELPLFVVGIESKDQIHVDWIIKSLPTARYSSALRQIFLVQRQMERRMTMSQVQKQLRSPCSSTFRYQH